MHFFYRTVKNLKYVLKTSFLPSRSFDFFLQSFNTFYHIVMMHLLLFTVLHVNKNILTTVLLKLESFF